MNDEDTKPNISIGGNINAGNFNTGNQTFHGNVTISYSALDGAPAGSAQDELKALLKELEDALKQAPADKAEDVELVKEYADEIAKEAAQDSPRKKKLEITGENLKKAAENLLAVAPIVGRIVQKLAILA